MKNFFFVPFEKFSSQGVFSFLFGNLNANLRLHSTANNNNEKNCFICNEKPFNYVFMIREACFSRELITTRATQLESDKE
jgi:hypothetical protein